MYKIVSNSKIVAICEAPRFVRKSLSSGAWVQTEKDKAEAVSIKGDLYGFNGNEIEGRPTADVFKLDGAEYIFDNYATQNSIAALEDALCEMDKGE